MSRHGHDETVVVGTFTECLAKARDIAGEVVLFDDSIGPDESHELVFFHHPPTIAHQDKEDVERFGGKRKHVASSQQQAPSRIQLKFAELVKPLLSEGSPVSHRTDLPFPLRS